MNKARAIAIVSRYADKPSEHSLIASRNNCFGWATERRYDGSNRYAM